MHIDGIIGVAVVVTMTAILAGAVFFFIESDSITEPEPTICITATTIENNTATMTVATADIKEETTWQLQVEQIVVDNRTAKQFILVENRSFTKEYDGNAFQITTKPILEPEQQYRILIACSSEPMERRCKDSAYIFKEK